MSIISQFIYAFLSTVGFSILFNIPKDSIVKSGISGALGWMMFIFINSSIDSAPAAAFLGALTVGIAGETLAIYYKKPATVFIIPGIIPLVPGAGMYYTMLKVLERNFLDAANIGSEAIFTALSIASGIIIPSSIGKLFRKAREKRLLR